MTISVGWKRRKCKEVGTTFIVGAAVRLSVHCEGSGDGDGQHSVETS
jgi:hypothetical protein